MVDDETNDVQLKALYDQLLELDPKHRDRMRVEAQRAGQGIRTGITLHSKAANNESSEFDLWIPKYAITMFCARTGGGKTTWAVNLAVRMVQSGAQGMFITLEEPGFAIRSKLMACYSRIQNPNHSMEAITNWEAQKVIAGKADYFDEGKFNKEIMHHVRIVDANTAVDLDKICSPTVMYQPQFIADLIKVRNSKAERPLDFVMIDFGQLMESMDADNSSSYMRMKAVMQGLKNLSGALGIAVIVGAQLQRSCASVPIWEWEPEMIRDGSDMEQAASLIIAIGQDKDYHDKECNMATRFLKNRHGPKRVAGMFNIEFDKCFIPNNGRIPSDDAA